MRTEIICRNYNASDKLREIILKKIEKLSKYFDGDTAAKVNLTENGGRLTMEITIKAGNSLLRAETASGNQYDNIDAIMPKIEKQILKFRSKYDVKNKKADAAAFQYQFLSGYEAEALPKITKRKVIDLLPMTPDEAIDNLELIGHDFFVFFNSDTGYVNIVYKRKDGDFGLLDLNY
ncbi:MAG: ribosome-associated translation inhibitor RaiA [Clostridiales bacterium]|jgi:putative sigma-54 modulation protein|nr:ribosome-associated translation inhibitor RaiA [Clostridiales bacterium]